MPSLICDLRPDAATEAAAYQDLRFAGEPVTVLWPAGVSAPESGQWRLVTAIEAWEMALEDELIACLGGGVPGWLPVADMDRVLLVSSASAPEKLTAAEACLAEALFAAGAEAVELVPPAALCELSQSWHSGRRADTIRLTPARR